MAIVLGRRPGTLLRGGPRIVSRRTARYFPIMASAALRSDPTPGDEPHPEIRLSAAALAGLGLREDDVIAFRVEGDVIVLRASRFIEDPTEFYAGRPSSNAINYAD